VSTRSSGRLLNCCFEQVLFHVGTPGTFRVSTSKVLSGRRSSYSSRHCIQEMRWVEHCEEDARLFRFLWETSSIHSIGRFKCTALVPVCPDYKPCTSTIKLLAPYNGLGESTRRARRFLGWFFCTAARRGKSKDAGKPE
jgi:hypothetical protein